MTHRSLRLLENLLDLCLDELEGIPLLVRFGFEELTVLRDVLSANTSH